MQTKYTIIEATKTVPGRTFAVENQDGCLYDWYPTRDEAEASIRDLQAEDERQETIGIKVAPYIETAIQELAAALDMSYEEACASVKEYVSEL